MDNWEVAAIAGMAFLGGLVYAVYFWLASNEKFDGRKFGMSVISALFAAAVFAVGYSFVDKLDAKDLLLALGSGVGVTAAGSKVLGGSAPIGS